MELNVYLSLPLIPRTSDPMLWWADYVRQKDGLSKSPLAQLAAILGSSSEIRCDKLARILCRKRHWHSKT